MVEILKREKVTALWTKELFKVSTADMYRWLSTIMLRML